MIKFIFNNALRKQKVLSSAKRLVPVLKKLSATKDFSDETCFVHLPFDSAVIDSVSAVVALKKKLNPKLIVVVGIGGSSLGAIAVQEALLGRQWNLHNHPRILYADTVDPDALQAIIAEMQDVLRQGLQVLINVVSKSGTTVETVADFEVLLNVLKRHRKNAENYVVMTTTRDSSLWSFAVRNGFSLLEIPKKLVGRYSVFSPVGLFPLGMLGIDIRKLVEGAANMCKLCLGDVKKNPAVLGAVIIFLHRKKGRVIYDNFLFSTDFESLGKWCRQLLAESIGKSKNAGITPTVSIGSTDLHSQLQLYLAGPDNRLTNFVFTPFNSRVSVPFYPDYNALVPNLQKKELSALMSAIYESVKFSYTRSGLPFTETILARKDAYCIGAFMQLKMIETVLLASLFRINPFDQPAVEEYKKRMRAEIQSLSGRV